MRENMENEKHEEPNESLIRVEESPLKKFFEEKE